MQYTCNTLITLLKTLNQGRHLLLWYHDEASKIYNIFLEQLCNFARSINKKFYFVLDHSMCMYEYSTEIPKLYEHCCMLANSY